MWEGLETYLKMGQGSGIRICREGILINSNDSDSLAQGIEFLLDNPEVADDMGKRGRVSVKERFDIKRLAKDMKGMYERLIKNVKLRNIFSKIISTILIFDI